MSRFRRLLPVFEWLHGYGRPTFASDLAAGVTVGAVLIPQGMAYAMVAGLGVARLGFVADLLSHPVLSGFTSAAALIIVSSQLRAGAAFDV
jgi:SulP family sulfate permease